MSLKKVCSRIKYCSFITRIFGNKLEKSKVCFQTKKEEKIFFCGFVIPYQTTGSVLYDILYWIYSSNRADIVYQFWNMKSWNCKSTLRHRVYICRQFSICDDEIIVEETRNRILKNVVRKSKVINAKPSDYVLTEVCLL